ncbi:MAG TPA: VCBS repeat-containing protein, partial [Micromonosporaceae bacterium]|nr:VCBS repeat-containing protein [Micromonosporaceae bacterium]
TTGSLYLYQGTGVGGFLFGNPARGDWSEFDTIVSAWDFDGDGDNDLIARHRTTKNLRLYKGNAVGGFKPGRIIDRDWSEFDSVFSVRDFSGDGRPDLIAKHSSTGDLHLYEGNGTGGFESGGGQVVGKDFYRFDIILSPGDFDGDGDNDLIARHRTTKDLHLYRGNGTGGFQSGTGGVISANWSVFDSVFSVGDFTSDGRPDLIARHATTKDLHLYLGDGVGGFLAGSGNVIGYNWAAYDQLL